MKLPDQIGDSPKQPTGASVEDADRTEHKTTSPEEATVMTQQRRRTFGLGESKELTFEEKEAIEADIQRLLERLDDYVFASYSPEIQEAWYWAELEAEAGKDRELANANLERFLNVLVVETEKRGKQPS